MSLLLCACEGGGGALHGTDAATDGGLPDQEITMDFDGLGRDGARPPDEGLPDATRPPPDAGPERDADGADAGGLDANPLDAGPPDDLDAAARDAVAPDASWGPCSVNGIGGECLPTALCAAPGEPVPGHCPGPADIQCCVEASEGPFACDPNDFPQPNLGLVEAPGDPGCPAGMAAVANFCMDRYEASLVQADGSPWSPYHNPGNTVVRAVALAGAVPQGYIDGIRAGAACVAAGKRLCTDVEWLRACQGAEGRTYPYGPNRQPGVCNDARAQHPAVELFPHDPNPFARIQDACINQLPASLALTGDHPGCVVPEGVYDLMGNLHEWTADPEGTFRGGFYVDTVVNGPGCLYRTTAHNTAHWDYSTGFRCCADQ